MEADEPPSRRDRASLVVAIVIVAAIVVPMLWLVLSTAITGSGVDPDEPDRFPIPARPSP